MKITSKLIPTSLYVIISAVVVVVVASILSPCFPVWP